MFASLSPTALSAPVLPVRRRLCIVDDDVATREMLSAYLEQHGIEVTALDSAEALLARVGTLRPDLVVLDVGLSGMGGLDACRNLRSAGHQMPILMLSGLGDEVDRILGLEMGADDYQCKPFSARELLARIHALLRRAGVGPALERPGGVRIGDYRFDPTTRSLHRGQEVRVLNGVEHALLATLCERPGQPVSREKLHAAAHPQPDGTLLRAVDAGIMRLRRLLEPDPSEPRYIQTVRGQGYMLLPSALR